MANCNSLFFNALYINEQMIEEIAKMNIPIDRTYPFPALN